MHKESHVANTKHGMGDYQGVGIKNPIGKARDVMDMNYKKSSKLKKSPKALA